VAWADDEARFARDWTAALLTFGRAAFARGTISDVVAWTPPGETKSYRSLHVALVGDALKIAREFGYLHAPDEDIDMGAPARGIAYHIRGILRAPHTAEGIRYDSKIQLSDLLDRLGGQAAGEFAEHPFDETHVRLIIEPGYPWPLNDAPGLVYWSAKSQKMVEPERPGWLIRVEDRDEPSKTKLGVNPCLVFPPEPRDREWPLWGRAGKQDMIVTHSMSLLASKTDAAFPFLGTPGSHSYKQTNVAAANIRACGGLLFPSLAVGPIPASNFGPISLVGHLGLILDGLTPFGRWASGTSWTYEHDAWTVNTSELMRDVSVRLFDELHGHEDFIYGYHIWTLGPPAELMGGPSEGSSALRSFSKLATAMKRRSATFKRKMTEEQFAAANEKVAGTVDKYAYCEAKARRVITLSEFPYLVGPESLRERIESFARDVGYPGEVVLIHDSLGVADDMAPDRDYRLFQWSWIVADAIKKLAPPTDLR
jgi:hypothetical protein